MKPTEEEKQEMLYLGQVPDDKPRPTEFDFSLLNQVPLSIKLDVGGSAYWSEIAQMQTLDNLLMNGQINVVDYLERVPNGYISNQQELIQTLRERMGMVQPAMQGQTGAVQAGQGNNRPGGGFRLREPTEGHQSDRHGGNGPLPDTGIAADQP